MALSSSNSLGPNASASYPSCRESAGRRTTRVDNTGMDKGEKRQFRSSGGESNMCEVYISRRPIARRGVLKLAVAATAGLLAQGVTTANTAEPAKSENVLSPDAALDRLMKGNARY